MERLEKVRIGGIERWVSIPETDKRNPFLLVIHGARGYVTDADERVVQPRLGGINVGAVENR